MRDVTVEQLRAALDAAARAHHDYETVALRGKRDEQWSGFYAAYMLGRLGDLMRSDELAAVLDQVEATSNWSAAAGRAVAAVMAERNSKVAARRTR